MVEPAQLQRRCVQFASALELYDVDEVALLRTARRLKHVHADLTDLLDTRVEKYGWTPRHTEARVVIVGMERELRRVLLDYQILDRRSVRSHLTAAVEKSLLALDLLR
jgi:hypothetical protein